MDHPSWAMGEERDVVEGGGVVGHWLSQKISMWQGEGKVIEGGGKERQ